MSRSSNVLDSLTLDFRADVDLFGGAVRSLVERCPVLTNIHVDWKETPAAHIFRADLPGVCNGEAKVEVQDGGVLPISGKHAREEGKEKDKWHRVQHSRDRFERRFRLPHGAKVLLGWRCSQEATDDLGGRLQDQEEHPQNEGSNLPDMSLAESSEAPSRLVLLTQKPLMPRRRTTGR